MVFLLLILLTARLSAAQWRNT